MHHRAGRHRYRLAWFVAQGLTWAWLAVGCRTDSASIQGGKAGKGGVEASAPAARPKARTAATRALEEAKADGDVSYVEKRGEAAAKGKDWGGWQYGGSRGACFFQVDRRCASTFEEACELARCETRDACRATGEAPVRVVCRDR